MRTTSLPVPKLVTLALVSVLASLGSVGATAGCTRQGGSTNTEAAGYPTPPGYRTTRVGERGPMSAGPAAGVHRGIPSDAERDLDRFEHEVGNEERARRAPAGAKLPPSRLDTSTPKPVGGYEQ
jgi:hypothetical protein